MTSANKVGDLFSAAGEACTKLAELAFVIQSTLNHTNLNGNNSDRGWSPDDTELLQLAVKRFGEEINVISEHIKDKTMCQIKSTFRKIQPSLSKCDDLAAGVGIVSSQHSSSAYPSTSIEETSKNRIPAIKSTSNLLLSAEGGRSHLHPTSAPSMSISSEVINTSENTPASSLLPQTCSTVTATTLTMAASSTTVSTCSSPSPFLHYPLLRKSADITLNMLNARDDSDDEDRIASSVF